MKKISMHLLKTMTLVFMVSCAMSVSAQDCGTVKDADGNEYKTVKIGSQCWFAENLKTTKYNNGNNIKNVTDNSQWSNCKEAAYCWYENNSGYKDEYGALYNWFAASSGKLCPTGWHVSTDADWTTLENKLGKDEAAAKLRETGTAHWKATTDKVTNETNFTMLAAGLRDPYGNFSWKEFDERLDSKYMGAQAAFWTSTGKTVSYAWNRTNYYYDNNLNRHEVQKWNGFSVRCVKD